MMLGYYLQLALHSLKRSPILTTLMVLAIGLGIGASMTMLTVLHVMAPGIARPGANDPEVMSAGQTMLGHAPADF